MRTGMIVVGFCWGLGLLRGAESAQSPGDKAPWPVLQPAAVSDPLSGTSPLAGTQDFAQAMIQAADALLLRKIDQSMAGRSTLWQRDLSSWEAYRRSVAPNRERFAKQTGVSKDPRVSPAGFEFVSPVGGVPLVNYDQGSLWWVRWEAFGKVHGEGFLLEPNNYQGVNLIALSDADHTADQLARDFANPDSQESGFARWFGSLGCRLLLPMLVDRSENEFHLSRREWLHRPAFELGRTLAGYEVQKILAAVDEMEAAHPGSRTGILGWGEGGRLALYAGALDERLRSVCVASYFGSRQEVWNEPADRQVSGLLREFGDAEIATLILPRTLVINQGVFPDAGYRLGADGRPELLKERQAKPGKPGRLHSVPLAEARAEVERLRGFTAGLQPEPTVVFQASPPDREISGEAVAAWLSALGVSAEAPVPAPGAMVSHLDEKSPQWFGHRMEVQVSELEVHNQWALEDSRRLREEWFKAIRTDTLGNYQADMAVQRQRFREEVIGDLHLDKVLPAPQSRRYQEGAGVVSYEVRLEVSPGWFTYGILTLPEVLDLSGKEKRPVVVCQHGLEGRPQDVVGEAGFKAYSAFATTLAQQGFVTFAPQNPYIFNDHFRTLQFKAQSLGASLFSLIVPQHEQIVSWLGSLPFVDAKRIGFYGLSYGGKSAMRLPALVEGYSLSICSADFNEWVWKNAATDPRSLRYSYANKGEYEIFEWDLGSTFNYAEMAALICPRPFMVERGHFDGVAPDEMVAFEYAKVRRLYQALLGIGDRTEIEWFAGPHKINGVGTFRFLRQHLVWPAAP